MMENMKCQQVIIDTSMYCEVRNNSDKEWRLNVVLIKVTRAHSGKYMGNVKFGTRNETRIIDLKTIEKPQIRETQKPILLKPFSTKCTVDSEFDDLKYHWKLNGTNLNSTERINARSSYLRFTRLMMTDKFSLFSCTVCSEMNCCIESEHYASDPYYGPDNITLSLNESDIYLRVSESFNITCLAKCYPDCSFFWDGHIDADNAELIINRFDSRMDGVYECIATNPETNKTANSRPIFLHYVPGNNVSFLQICSDSSKFASSPGGNGGYQVELLGLGLLIVAVLLVVIGLRASATVWRKNASTELALRGPSPICQPNFDPNIPKSTREITRKQDRRLPTPGVQENKRRNVKRSNYPKVCRKSKSFSNIFDVTENVWNPARQSLSLQRLIHLSHTIERHMKTDKSASLEYKFEGAAGGIGQEELCAKSQSLKRFEHESFDFESKMDLYSTIDEASVSITNCDRSYEPQENLPQNSTKDETGKHIYDYETLPALIRDA
ncbi:hypothetical protein CHS0354_042254 [Potamilus streckersoni]|uniref:Ig-like domain-containing protein n=1 Tax=Potamilus streckersoni TaxID=2493646 RepID=A0AAE0W2I5_9BIVA|nr:hypothetical protein CHS0354_042254 [Potamilus streckersoni]